MIAHLRGRLIAKNPNRVVIETGGVGYEVFIPVSTFYDLAAPGAEVDLHIYTHVREDSLTLYGFRTEKEKNLFEKLLSVSGVGPKLAVTVLSGLEMEELVPAIRRGDVNKLVHIPGVGRKTAERLIVELREKLDKMAIEEAAVETKVPATRPASVEDDVLSALVNLGYTSYVAEMAVREARQEAVNGDFEQLLKASLRLLARKFFS
ncbi:MAG: Holliday junction branch migration protein RuvA [Acidobacteria bacterium]|nr:Holliday junction branch migration protein RuvA [Acidobacteriota bacterium]